MHDIAASIANKDCQIDKAKWYYKTKTGIGSVFLRVEVTIADLQGRGVNEKLVECQLSAVNSRTNPRSSERRYALQ